MLVAGLTTGHVIGLSVMAAIFIGFALLSSFVLPRYRPDFPGKNGLSVFVIVCFLLFALMIAAVEIFGADKKESGRSGAAPAHIARLR